MSTESRGTKGIIQSMGWRQRHKSERKETRKSSGKLCTTPKKFCPGTAGRTPPLSENDEGRWPIPPMPEYISRVKEEGNKNKRHRVHNPWPYPAALLEPLYWFWASLEWYKTKVTSVPGDDITTTSFAELTIAFQFITGVNPCQGTHENLEKTTLYQTENAHLQLSHKKIRYTAL